MSCDAPPPPPPPGYGYGMPGQPYVPQDHPKAQLAMILGILGLVVCGVLAFPAYFIGKKAVEEIDASGGQLGGRSMANAGKILGIVGMALVALAVVFFVLFLGLVLVGSSTSTTSG